LEIFRVNCCGRNS